MSDIQDITLRYADKFRSECNRLVCFMEFLNANERAGYFDRKNFTGHVTTSALILDSAQSAVLMIHHKFLDRWLSPGGHIDANESPMQAVFREVEEETGINKSELILIETEGLPLDIDSHRIPPNPAKGEPAHYHHDLRYLMQYTGNGELILNEDETIGQRWIPLAELSGDTGCPDLVRKIRSALNVPVGSVE